MIDYAAVLATVRSIGATQTPSSWDGVVDRMIQLWLTDYSRRWAATNLVRTTVSSAQYLFDVNAQRLIAAWAVSTGRHAGARDASRMAGHPSTAGRLYHRGHAIPHTLGGPTDINLVMQLGSVNVGPFRPLEKQAVATPGSLYFTYWQYRGKDTQKPSGVDQGLIIPGGVADVRHHGN